MFVLKVLPILIFLLQVISIVHLYTVYKTENAHVPMAFIELNIIVLINIVIFICIYFFLHKFQLRSVWSIPLIIFFLLMLMLSIFYIWMIL